MSYNLAQIAGSTIPSSGSPVALKTAASGAVIIANASQVFFYVQIGGTGNFHLLPNNVGDIFEFDEGASYVSLIPQYTVITGGANPDKLSFIVLSAAEYKNFRGNYPVVLGGQIGVASVTNVANDGNPAGTVFIEGTAGADTPSDVTLTNDGHLTTTARYSWAGRGIGAGFPIAYEWLPVGATVNNNWAWLYSGADGRLLLQDQTANKTAIQVSPGGPVGFNMGVGNVGGQATVGSFGVPVIVALTKAQNITVTTLQTVLTWTPAASPTEWLVKVHIVFTTGANGGSCSAKLTFTDAHTSAVFNYFFSQAMNGSATIISALGVGVNTQVGAISDPVSVKGGTTLTVAYQDTTPGPNDFVSAWVELVG